MKKIKDGGSAFPMVGPKGFFSNGLSKREWFAGMALIGAMYADVQRTMRGIEPKEKADTDLADTCFQIADVMIKAGEKGK